MPPYLTSMLSCFVLWVKIRLTLVMLGDMADGGSNKQWAMKMQPVLWKRTSGDISYSINLLGRTNWTWHKTLMSAAIKNTVDRWIITESWGWWRFTTLLLGWPIYSPKYFQNADISWEGREYSHHLFPGWLPSPAWHWYCLNVKEGGALRQKSWHKCTTGIRVPIDSDLIFQCEAGSEG